MSVAIGAIVYALTRSFAMALGVLVGGVLIDLDHFVDYFIYRGIHVNLKDMFHLSYNNLFPKFYLLLHSYELVALMWILVIFFIRNKLVTGLAIGFTIHIIQDEVGNCGNPLFYFLTFRIFNKFDGDKMVPRKFRGKPSPPLSSRWRNGSSP
ncbi:MAG: hypothetical protein P9M00_01140 [Candidatus Tritonobacter lacicola]|nr:hypothetical protein [Candidatus Tritonobacter lacicola]